MRRPSRSQLARLVDSVIPVVVTLFLVLVVLGDDPDQRTDLRLALGVPLAVIQGAALRWRRLHPGRVAVIVLPCAAGLQLLAPDGTIPAAGLFAVGSLAAARPPRVSLPALAALLAVCALAVGAIPGGDVLFAMALSAGAWALGEAARNRRAALDQEARRAAVDERERIARELHDVIAHTVSVIVVQAAAADDVFERRPAEARTALRSIESSAREALTELRRLLAFVRSDGADGEESAPQPGLARLDELAEPLRRSGLAVRVDRDEELGSLPPGIDLSTYRIAQEALTNVVRHAGASRAEVAVRRDGDALELTVLDDGAGAATEPAGGGQGIVGMRERVAMLGGTFEAGPLAGGGYRVRARLPLDAEDGRR